jgi:hypothetical protein
MTDHAVSVTSYDWVLGRRWRWMCLCGLGSSGYVHEHWARTHADAHLENEAARQDRAPPGSVRPTD